MMAPQGGEGGGFGRARRELLSSLKNEACSVQILSPKTKDVVFKGLSESFGYGGGGERKMKKKKKKKKNVERSERMGGLERE